MKKILVLSIFLSAFLAGSFAQEKTVNSFTVPKNSIGATLNYPLFGFSAEYGRVVVKKEKWFLNGSIGLGAVVLTGGFTVPHQLTFNFGKRSGFFEAGLGGVFWNGLTDASGFTDRESEYNFGPLIGWRKYCKRKVFFRVFMNPYVLSPVSSDFEDIFYILNTGVSFGYSF